MIIRDYGPGALLVDQVADPAALAIAARHWPGVRDAVAGAQTVLIDAAGAEPGQWAAIWANVEAHPDVVAPQGSDQGETVEIPVVYNGPDLAAVAQATGLSEAGVIERHIRARYRCAFIGFAPGFAYLTGLDPVLHLPRLETPRTRVPVGAVAIAGAYASVYPSASPGGWLLLGRTSRTMFDPLAANPALVTAGAHVRFVVAS